jgi:hypothetical protein
MMTIAQQLEGLAPTLAFVPGRLVDGLRRWWILMHTLREALHGLDAAQQAELLRAIAPSLEAWPAFMRRVPSDWSSPEGLAREAALISLCRSCSIGPAIVDAEQLAAWLGAPALAHITHLMLYGVRLNAAAVEALGAVRSAGVVVLRLERCWLNAPAVVAMCAHPTLLVGLTELDLRDNKISREGAEALAGCAHLSTLDRLMLRKNPITLAGRIALGRSPHLSDAAKRTARAAAVAPLDAALAPVVVSEMFGDVRSALQQAPSAHGWARICDLVARIDPERARHETLPYAEAGLAAWSAAQRPLMAAWQEQIASGDPVPPAAQLARSLELSGDGLNTERAARLGSWAAQAGVSRIEIGAPLSDSALAALLREPGAGALRALHHRCWTGTRALEVLVGQPAPLTALSLGVTGEAVRPSMSLLHGEATASLRAFGVEGFEDEPGQWGGLREAGWWWGLEALRLGGAMSPRARRAAPVTASLLGGASDPAWGALEVLSLRGLTGRELLDGGAEALAARLPALRALTLEQVPEDSALWALLARLSGSLESLELGLVSRSLPVLERARHIASSDLPGLRRLAMTFARGFDEPDSAGPTRLLGAPWLAGLDELELGCFARDDAWSASALRALPVGLGALSLTQCVLGDASGEALASRPFEALRALRLSGAQLSEGALGEMTRAGWWSGLESLSLHMDYGPANAAPLAALAGRLPPGLKALRISCSVEAPVVALLEGGLPGGLASLSLQQGAVASKAFRLLVEQLGDLPQLHTLELDGDHIVASALPRLLESPHLGRIPLITMRSCKLGHAGKQLILDSPAAPISLKSAL